MAKTKQNFFSATRICVIALFSALAGVLYILRFPISAAFPFWLELDFSYIPALIGTFALGPVSGMIIIFFKVIIKLIFQSTSTVFVGDLANLLIGVAFVVPAGIVYKKKRTFSGALLGMLLGMACSVAVAVLTNWLILIPFMVQLYFGGDWSGIVSAVQVLFPSCTRENFYNFYLWVSVVPFNIMECLIASVVTLLVYKHISRAINRFGERFAKSGEKKESKPWLAALIFALVVLLLIGVVLLVYFLA